MVQLEWTDETNELQLLEFDAVPREGFEAPAEITEHAVEQGAAISDHVRAGSDTVSLEAVVTNTPILVPGTAMDGASGGTQPATLQLGGGRTATVRVLQWTQAFDRVRRVDEILRGLRDRGVLLTVRTDVRELSDVVIQRYKVDRDANTGNVLAFNLDLKKIRIATSERVAVQAPAQRRGRRSQNRGPQPATPAPADRRSALERTRQGIARSLGL